MKFRDWDRLPDNTNAVTIFGAGVAGLTAAHELVERGFSVQVWENQPDPRYPERGCDVGGMARTQWSGVTWPPERDLDRLTGPIQVAGAAGPPSASGIVAPAAAFKERSTHSIQVVPYRFYVRCHVGKFQSLKNANDDPKLVAELTLRALIHKELGARQESNTCRITLYGFHVNQLDDNAFRTRYEIVLTQLNTLFDKALTPAPENALNRSEFRFRLEKHGLPATIEVSLRDISDPNGARISIQWDSGELNWYRRVWSPEPSDLDSASGVLSPARGGVAPSTPGLSAIVIANRDAASELLDEVTKQVDLIYVEIAAEFAGHLKVEEAERRIAAVLSALGENAPFRNHPKYNPRFIDRLPYQIYEDVPQDIEVVIGFRPRERWLPGEHGYRFFPSFYHHLFDTMQRTPLLDTIDKSSYAQAQERSAHVRSPEPVNYVDSGRTVFDNIHPTTSYALAFAKGERSSQVARTPISSFEELKQYLNIVFGSRESGGFGLTPRDAGRLTLKVLQFATACEARRRDYEQLSWWEFLNADELSANAQSALERLPEALVAMDAKECDARTQWVPFIQILLDQVRAGTYRDGTLRGPTSEAWLNPWRAYLEAQGVEFIAGRLDGFEAVPVQNDADDGELVVWPTVTCLDPRYATSSVPLKPGYFVVAVSAPEARRLATEFSRALGEPEHDEHEHAAGTDSGARAFDSDLKKAETIGGDMPEASLKEELARPRPNSDYRHFAGIQYYFAEDLSWLDGHVYYPDSLWALTSISQARFWQDKMDWEHGYRGLLSAIVGAWDVESPRIGKTAWACTPDELAEEVWNQMREGILNLLEQTRTPGVGRFAKRTPIPDDLPEPIYWHIDENLKRKKNGFQNQSPFLIAAPGRFEERPGSVVDGYTVEHGVVLCGYYTQTYTRIPSMEAANESARHAVNAILSHLERKQAPSARFRRSYCDIWNPEDREVDDFAILEGPRCRTARTRAAARHGHRGLGLLDR